MQQRRPRKKSLQRTEDDNKGGQRRQQQHRCQQQPQSVYLGQRAACALLVVGRKIKLEMGRSNIKLSTSDLMKNMSNQQKPRRRLPKCLKRDVEGLDLPLVMFGRALHSHDLVPWKELLISSLVLGLLLPSPTSFGCWRRGETKEEKLEKNRPKVGRKPPKPPPFSDFYVFHFYCT